MAESLTDDREELMISPCGGNPVHRNAHFLNPTFTSIQKHPPPFPPSSKPLNPNINIKLCKGPPPKKWKTWVSKLMPKYQNIWHKTGIYQPILASTYHPPHIDKDLILGLAEKWCADTNTFIFPWGELTITLEDMVVLGGLSVLGVSVLSPLPKDLMHVFTSLRNVHKKIRIAESKNVNSKAWMRYFMGCEHCLEHEAFLALWLSRFVLIGSYNYIPLHIFPVAIHLSRGTRVALAPAVLASIYREMSLIQCGGLGDKVCGNVLCRSPMDLVQCWAYERFLEFRPVPNVIKCGEPRLARWDNVKTLAVKDVKGVLDSAGKCFSWRPYAMFSTNGMFDKLYGENEQWFFVESNVGVEIESFVRCLRVSELVGLDCIEHYSPHRVAMQFGLDQDLVPSKVSRINESAETAWSSYNRPIIGMKIYIPARLFESDVSSRYMNWWKNCMFVSKGGGAKFIPNPLVTSGYSLEEPILIDYVEEENTTDPELTSLKSKKKKCRKRWVVDDETTTNAELLSLKKCRKRCVVDVSDKEELKSFSRRCYIEGSAKDAPVTQGTSPLLNVVEIEEELTLEARIRKLELIVDGMTANNSRKI